MMICHYCMHCTHENASCSSLKFDAVSAIYLESPEKEKEKKQVVLKNKYMCIIMEEMKVCP